jgi:hypothetical protein
MPSGVELFLRFKVDIHSFTIGFFPLWAVRTGHMHRLKKTTTKNISTKSKQDRNLFRMKGFDHIYIIYHHLSAILFLK